MFVFIATSCLYLYTAGFGSLDEMVQRCLLVLARGIFGVDEDAEKLVAREFFYRLDEIDAPMRMQLENVSRDVEISLVEQNFADDDAAHFFRTPLERRKTLEGVSALKKCINVALLNVAAERDAFSDHELDVDRAVDLELIRRKILQVKRHVTESDARRVEVDRLSAYDVYDRAVAPDIRHGMFVERNLKLAAAQVDHRTAAAAEQFHQLALRFDNLAVGIAGVGIDVNQFFAMPRECSLDCARVVIGETHQIDAQFLAQREPKFVAVKLFYPIDAQRFCLIGIKMLRKPALQDGFIRRHRQRPEIDIGNQLFERVVVLKNPVHRAFP